MPVQHVQPQVVSGMSGKARTEKVSSFKSCPDIYIVLVLGKQFLSEGLKTPNEEVKRLRRIEHGTCPMVL